MVIGRAGHLRVSTRFVKVARFSKFEATQSDCFVAAAILRLVVLRSEGSLYFSTIARERLPDLEHSFSVIPAFFH
jgi:hypothetical protein